MDTWKRIAATATANPDSASVDPGTRASSHDMNALKKRNFIARNWRGEFPLWIAYWGFGFLGTIAVWIAVGSLSDILAEFTVFHPLTLLGWFVAAWSLAAVVTLWQLVGIWRSAGHSIAECRRSDKFAFWAWMARVMVIIGVLRFLGTLASVAAPQLAEGVRMAFLNDPETPDYVLRLMNEETEIEIVGGIKYGLDRDFRKMLEAAPRVRVVHLDSVGGRIGEAAKLYRTIRERGLSTYVSNECLSACGNIFIGGRERWISRSGQLGFHRGAFPGFSEEQLDEEGVFDETQIRESGISREFAGLVAKVAHADMWYPQTEELLRYKVVTGVADAWQFALSGIGGEHTRDDFESLLRERFPAVVPFSVLEPKEYAILLDEFHQGYLVGRSAGALVRAYDERIFSKAYTYLSLADDAVLHDYLTLVTEQLRYLLADRDAKVCAGFISGATSAARLILSADLSAREMEMLEQVLLTASARSSVLDETLQPDWEKVAEKAYLRIGKDDYELIWEPVAPTGREQAYCKAIIVYYEEILNLPSKESAALIRAMVRK